MGRLRVVGIACIWLALAAIVTPSATGAGFSSLRIFAASNNISVPRYGPDEPVYLDLGMYIASVGGPFQLQVERHDYAKPVQFFQVDPSTGQTRKLDRNLLADTWYGLADFLQTTITDAGHNVVFDETTGWCPNGYSRQRVNDSGPSQPVYPDTCGAHPLAKGAVWGIEKGWAVDPFSNFSSPTPDIPDGEYDVTISILEPFRALFGISAANASAHEHFTVETIDYPFDARKKHTYNRMQDAHNTPGASSSSKAPASSSSVPIMNDPPADLLPDLVAMPALNFFTDHATDTAVDTLNFGANEWNNGPQPMVIEGFRKPGDDLMDAYQYFYKGNKPVGRAKAGRMEYHSGGGHDHWHFLQFTTYTLVDADGNLVAPSDKQSWCLAPTDAIDMTATNAMWRPENTGLGSSCGGKTSVWIRETIPVGWGDTYYQVSGQAFNITDVPNGTYYVKVKVNPLGKLHERTTRNDVSLRKVVLGGTPGARTVDAEPYKGIDTENSYCGGFCGL